MQLQKNDHKFAVYTLGCRVNQHESRALADVLKDRGWKEVSVKEARTVIINVCAVTAKGSRKSRRFVNHLCRFIPEKKLFVMGCITDQDLESYLSLPQIKAIVPATSREKIFNILTGEPGTFTLKSFGGRTRAYVKVQDGCDRFCTYCIVPFVRGRSRSRTLNDIKSEIKGLFEQGVPEIWIVGTDLADWNGKKLPGLLKETASVAAQGHGRLRIGTVPLESLNNELLNAIKSSPAICNHLHLSLQSGSATIRSLMGRRTAPGEIIKRVNKFRDELPGISFTADVMVGFPGESEENFQETYALCKEIGFVKIHIFPYSIRPGTKAAEYPGGIPGNIISERIKQLNQLEKELFLSFSNRLIGKNVNVVVERAGDFCHGISGEYIRVAFPGTAALRGKIVPVTIDSVSNKELLGRIVVT